jgi:MFS family permease
MDNAGAVLGPLVGFVLLSWAHMGLRQVFAWAALPGALAVLSLVIGVKETPTAAAARPSQHAPDAAMQHDDAARQQRDGLRRYLITLALFTLGNSSDAFLLIRAAQIFHPGAGLGARVLADPHILLLWTAHNATKALLSHRAGVLSDRYGRQGVIVVGWGVYAGTYLAFAFASQAWQVWALFIVYGLYYALVEGAEKAMVADLAGAGRRGRAFGWYNATVGSMSLPASALFGLLYGRLGAVAAFGAAAALAFVASMLLLAWVRPPPRAT